MRIFQINKNLIIIGVVFVLFFVAFVLLIAPTKKYVPVVISPTATPYPTFIQPSFPPITLPVTSQEKIEISGILMNNFYRTGSEMNENGDVLIAENSQWSLEYQRPFQLFLVTVMSLPFEQNRTMAEQAFLTQLGITQDQACQLLVRVGVPFFVDPSKAKTSYPLSFCENVTE